MFINLIVAAWIVVAPNGFRDVYDKQPDPKLIPPSSKVIECATFKMRTDDPYLVQDNGTLAQRVESVTDGQKAKAGASQMLMNSASNSNITDAQFMKAVRIQFMQDTQAKQAWDALNAEVESGNKL